MARKLKKKTRNRLLLVLVLLIGYVYLYGVPPAIFDMMSGVGGFDEGYRTNALGPTISACTHSGATSGPSPSGVEIRSSIVETNSFIHGEDIIVRMIKTAPSPFGYAFWWEYHPEWAEPFRNNMIVTLIDESGLERFANAEIWEHGNGVNGGYFPACSWQPSNTDIIVDTSSIPPGRYELRLYKVGPYIADGTQTVCIPGADCRWPEGKHEVPAADQFGVTNDFSDLMATIDNWELTHEPSAQINYRGSTIYRNEDVPGAMIFYKDVNIEPEPCIYDPATEIPVTDVFINGETITTSALSSNFVKFCDQKPAYLYGLTKGQEVESGKYIPVAASIDRDYNVYYAIESGSVTVPPGFVYEITYIAQNNLNLECTGDTAFDPVTDQCISTGFLRSAREGQFFFIDDAGTIFLGAVATETCPAGSYWSDTEGRCIVDRCEEGLEWFSSYDACGVRIEYDNICSYGTYIYDTNLCEAYLGDETHSYDGYNNPKEYWDAQCSHNMKWETNTHGVVEYTCYKSPEYTCQDGYGFVIEDKDYPACLKGIGSGPNIQIVTPECPEGTTPREGICILTRTDVVELTKIEYQDRPVYPITSRTELTVNSETGDLEVTESASAADLLKSPLVLAIIGLAVVIGIISFKSKFRLG